MLTSARDEYTQQQRITGLAVRDARKRASRGPLEVARGIATYQAASIALALESTPLMLAEQGIDTDTAGRVNTAALLTGPATAGMVEKAASSYALDRLVQTLVTDANRTAKAVDASRRPAATGFARMVNTPCCKRCAVLAGRVYRDPNFYRHPGCDCMVTPTTLGSGLASNPNEMFERGQISDLTKAEADAIRDGADISQVVNVSRKGAGLVQGSSVMERAGRLTPAGIYRVASDPAEVQALMRRFGYIL